MKILYLIPRLDYGGAGKQLTLLLQGLPAEIGRCICALGPDGPLAGPLRSAASRVEPLGWTRRIDPRPAFRLRRLLAEFRPDVIHAWQPLALRFLLLAAGKRGRRLVFSAPAVFRKEPGALDRRLWRSVDRSIAQGRHEEDWFSRAGVEPGRIASIPPAVEEHCPGLLPDAAEPRSSPLSPRGRGVGGEGRDVTPCGAERNPEGPEYTTDPSSLSPQGMPVPVSPEFKPSATVAGPPHPQPLSREGRGEESYASRANLTDSDSNALRLQPGAKLLACVGPFEPHKAHREVIWALDILRFVRTDVHIALAGDGPDRGRIEEFIRRTNLQDRAKLLGECADLSGLLTRADIVIVPSRKPGGVNTALEAMAAGKPVVAGNVPGLSEVVVDGQTGLLFTPGDPSAMARQVRVLLDDPDLARRFGAAGRRRAADHFAVSALVSRHVSLYESLCRD